MAQILSPIPHARPRVTWSLGISHSTSSDPPFSHINSLVSFRYVSMSCLSHSNELLRARPQHQHRAWLGLSAQNQWMTLRSGPGGRKLKWARQEGSVCHCSLLRCPCGSVWALTTSCKSNRPLIGLPAAHLHPPAAKASFPNCV